MHTFSLSCLYNSNICRILSIFLFYFIHKPLFISLQQKSVYLNIKKNTNLQTISLHKLVPSLFNILTTLNIFYFLLIRANYLSQLLTTISYLHSHLPIILLQILHHLFSHPLKILLFHLCKQRVIH